MVTELEHRMTAVLAALELASHASAQTLDSAKVSHGKSGSSQPPRSSSPHGYFRRRYNAARTDAERREVVEEAEKELRSIRYSRQAPAHATKEQRLMIGTDPRAVADVAHVYGCSEGHVYRCRKEAQRAPKFVRQQARMTGSQRYPHL